ncbi:DUF4255 domain-containing protein [Halalkalibaculum sp. DA3122]|uniref:DUF4255 domain-containing protein n=1 Tax=unclassified Halalkalibaculum TaxID=2964617 RepID=UPI0037541859
MILEKSLTFIQEQLDTYLKQKTGENTSKVVLSDILKQNGDMAIDAEKVAIMLVNIEEEKIGKQQKAYLKQENGTYAKTNPEIRLNLFLLFVARFSNYDEAVKAISNVIAFFQSRNVFESSRHPSMGTSLEKLVFELQTMSFEQMNHLWGALGAKYMPSVLYKMRMVTIREDEIKEDVLPIKEIEIRGI